MGKLPATSLQHFTLFKMFAAKVFLHMTDVRSANSPMSLVYRCYTCLLYYTLEYSQLLLALQVGIVDTGMHVSCTSWISQEVL